MERKYERQDQSKSTEQFSNTKDIIEILSRNIGPKFLEYRKKFEQAAQFQVEPDFPVHIDIETVFGCNIKCVMCTHSREEARSRRKRFMGFELFKKVIDEGQKYGLPSIGLDQEGEPLLVKNLVDYIVYAREHGVLDVMINTNAMLLDKDRTEELLHCGLTRIHFSLDAITEESYARIRKGSDFKKVMENILYFCKRKKELNLELPITRVSFVKMKHNELEFEEFERFWSEHVDAIAIQEFNNPFPDDHDLDELYAEKKIVNKNFKCTQPWFRMVVLTDGVVLPCCLLGISLKMAIGNINNSTIYELWNSSVAKSLRKIHKEGRYSSHKVCNICAQNFI